MGLLAAFLGTVAELSVSVSFRSGVLLPMYQEAGKMSDTMKEKSYAKQGTFYSRLHDCRDISYRVSALAVEREVVDRGSGVLING